MLAKQLRPWTPEYHGPVSGLRCSRSSTNPPPCTAPRHPAWREEALKAEKAHDMPQPLHRNTPTPLALALSLSLSLSLSLARVRGKGNSPCPGASAPRTVAERLWESGSRHEGSYASLSLSLSPSPSPSPSPSLPLRRKGYDVGGNPYLLSLSLSLSLPLPPSLPPPPTQGL